MRLLYWSVGGKIMIWKWAYMGSSIVHWDKVIIGTIDNNQVLKKSRHSPLSDGTSTSHLKERCFSLCPLILNDGTCCLLASIVLCASPGTLLGSAAGAPSSLMIAFWWGIIVSVNSGSVWGMVWQTRPLSLGSVSSTNRKEGLWTLVN